MATVDQIINAESGGNPYARNPRSSAGGAGQFIDATWLETIKRHRPDIAQGKTDQQLLQLKFDPALSRDMTQAYAGQNSQFLQSRGINPTPGNVYLSHFAGPSGAAAIHADPGATIEALLGPDAVKANPFLQGKTGADVIAWANRKMSPAQGDAKALRQRYAPPSEAGKMSGMDRLKAALNGKSYDPDRLSNAQNLINQGQNIASTSGNWVGALGGTILSGIGGYQRNQEQDARKNYREDLGQALGTAEGAMEAARLLMASPDPKLQETGISLFSKTSLATRRASEEARKRGLTPVPMLNRETGQVEIGTIGADGSWKPLETSGDYQSAPRTTQKDTGTEIVTYDVYGNEIGRTKKDVAGKKEQEKVGEARGEAIARMPQIEGQAQDMLATINSVLDDPFLPEMTGWISGRLPNVGEGAARVQSKLDQLQGQVFLQGYERLKGGGVITDFEGQKAEQAIARLGKTTMSDEDYRQALEDLKAVAAAGLERARAGTQAGKPQDLPEEPGSGVIRWERGPDGIPRKVQ